MIGGVQHFEGLSEELRYTCRIVSTHRQTAALFRAVQRKSSQDEVPFGPDCSSCEIDVAFSVFRLGQEVKDSAVMPHVELAEVHGFEDVLSAQGYQISF